MRNKSHDYINGAALCESMRPWLDAIKKLKKKEKPQTDFPQMPECVGQGIMQIVNGLSRKPNFCNYTYLEEMKSDALVACCLYLHNFDLDKSKNVFAYITQIAYHTFLKRIEIEKTHAARVNKLKVESVPFSIDRGLEKMMRPQKNDPDFLLEENRSIAIYEAKIEKHKQKVATRKKLKVVNSKE